MAAFGYSGNTQIAGYLISSKKAAIWQPFLYWRINPEAI